MAYQTPYSGKDQRPKPQVIWFASSVVDTPITVDKADLQPTPQNIGGLWSVSNDIALPTILGQSITLSYGTVLAVTKADFQPDGSSVAFNISLLVDKADIQPIGQTVVLSETWSLAVDSEALQPVGQTITLNQTWSLVVGSAALEPTGQDITLTWSMGGVDTPPAVAPSGGWIESGWERRHARLTDELRKELREEQEREELADRLEQALVQDKSLTQAAADLIRLRGLASEYRSIDLPNRARRALAFAERAQSELSLKLAMREIRKLQEEEEMAVMLLMTLD